MSNPEIVAELTRLAARRGGELHPADVVRAARPETSVLHSHFDWDDSTAAEKYRLWQARRLIRVVVDYTKLADGTTASHRVFVSLTPDRENDSGYRVTVDVMNDPAQRAQLLADARADMRRFTAKYRQLTELAAVFDAMADAARDDEPDLPPTERAPVSAELV